MLFFIFYLESATYEELLLLYYYYYYDYKYYNSFLKSEGQAEGNKLFHSFIHSLILFEKEKPNINTI